MNNGALNKIRVVDLTRVLAGPYCSMLLADMGAEIIKVENPSGGDDSRAFGPFINGESSYYINLNRNKMGLTLDLKKEEAKEVFFDLVRTSDIVLENYRPGTMEKLGIGYEDLKKVNPSIIYGCISGFGHYGPYKDRAGYDIIGQAMGGLMSTTGWPDGVPTRTGTAIADVLGGLNLAIGVLAAYISRESGGKGQKVDIALVDSVVSALEIINQIYLLTGKTPQRIGNRYESVYPYDSFKVKDGDVVIACGNEKLFALLLDLMGKPGLIRDERFATNTLRIENHSLLKTIIEDWLKDFTIDEAVEKILTVGIPAGPINTIDRVVKDPHIGGAREMFVEIEHPTAGRMKITGNQLKFSKTPVQVRTPSPLLGQHNEYVMREILGYPAERIEMLKKEHII